MYKHVLIPIELGGAGDLALARQAAEKLVDADGKLTLLHAVQPIPNYVEAYVPPDLNAQTLTGAKDKLNEIAAELGVANTVVKIGSAGRTIVDWATENDVDCIVIASHQPAMSDILLGSTAAWVVRHTPTAIHVVR